MRLRLALALLAIAACSSGGSTSTPPTNSSGVIQIAEDCATVLAPGRNTTSTKDFACQSGSHAYAAAHYDCVDGRTLAYSDVAWGYVGEPAHRFIGNESTKTPPADEMAACRG